MASAGRSDETSTSRRYGAVEMGGTKVLCATGTGPADLGAIERIPTTRPDETLQAVVAYVQNIKPAPAAIGVASFGPLDLEPTSPTFGAITRTPKPGWSGVDVAGTLTRALDLPVYLDTDVNGAVLGEQRWGAARGLRDVIYLTVGTGIGGGALVAGRLLHGRGHPEMGHIHVPHDRQADPFAGCCPYHGDCLEGLASGTALAQRWGQPAETLPAAHPAWELEARYLGLALATLTAVLAPQRVILGGGVMKQAALWPLVRQQLRAMSRDYPAAPAIWERLDEYVVPAGLDDRAGLLGAIALAEQADRRQPR
jgi:fructokinase